MCVQRGERVGGEGRRPPQTGRRTIPRAVAHFHLVPVCSEGVSGHVIHKQPPTPPGTQAGGYVRKVHGGGVVLPGGHVPSLPRKAPRVAAANVAVPCIGAGGAALQACAPAPAHHVQGPAAAASGAALYPQALRCPIQAASTSALHIVREEHCFSSVGDGGAANEGDKEKSSAHCCTPAQLKC